MSITRLFLVPVLALGLVAACEGGERKSIADQIGPPTKNLADLKQESKVSEEELAKRRKEAGFKSKAEVDAEAAAKNAEEFEKAEREHVKTRLKEYRALTDGTRKLIDDIEKEATKWAAAKDPQKAFDKGGKALQDRAKELQKQLDALSEKGVKGGNTQAQLNKVYRPLEELSGALAPEVQKDPKFGETLTALRTELEASVKALDDIEKDETLEVNKFYEGGEGEDAKKKKAK